MIYDIYIARKKDKEGNRFGFISALDVKDKEETCKKLSSIRMGGYRLRFNVARYVLEEGEIGVEREGDGRNYAEKGKGEGEDKFGGRGSGKATTWNAGGRSFKDMLVGEMKEQLNVRSVTIEALRKLKITMKEICMMEGRVQYIGVSALISYEDRNSAMGPLEVGKPAGKKFSQISLWEGQTVDFERLAWLKVYGIPLHLLTNRVIDSMGGLLGKIVHKAERSELDSDHSFEFVSVLVGEGRRIADEVLVNWDDRKYRVWVLEEMGDWVPEFDEPYDLAGDLQDDGRVGSEFRREEVTGSATEGHRSIDVSFKAMDGYFSPPNKDSIKWVVIEEDMQEGGLNNSNMESNKFSLGSFHTKKRKKYKKKSGTGRPSSGSPVIIERPMTNKRPRFSPDVFGLNKEVGEDVVNRDRVYQEIVGGTDNHDVLPDLNSCSSDPLENVMRSIGAGGEVTRRCVWGGVVKSKRL